MASPAGAKVAEGLGYRNITVLDHGQETTIAGGKLKIRATAGGPLFWPLMKPVCPGELSTRSSFALPLLCPSAWGSGRSRSGPPLVGGSPVPLRSLFVPVHGVGNAQDSGICRWACFRPLTLACSSRGTNGVPMHHHDIMGLAVGQPCAQHSRAIGWRASGVDDRGDWQGGFWVQGEVKVPNLGMQVP